MAKKITRRLEQKAVDALGAAIEANRNGFTYDQRKQINQLAVLTPQQREEVKAETLKIHRAAAEADPAEARRSLGWSEEFDKWRKAEDELRLHRDDVPQRVKALRAEFENYRQQLEGAPFDILCGDCDSPASLGNHERKHTVELIDALSPAVEARLKMIDGYTKEYGCHENLDFQSKLFELKMLAAQTGYWIGLLAGAILAGCPKEIVDRFERGMVFGIQSDHRFVKE